MANEVAIGLLLGLGVTIMFSGIQVAGQIVSQMSGLSLADVFDPGFDENVSMFTQLFHFLTMAVFVAIGGHRIMIEAVLQTFAWAPPGHADAWRDVRRRADRAHDAKLRAGDQRGGAAVDRAVPVDDRAWV